MSRSPAVPSREPIPAIFKQHAPTPREFFTVPNAISAAGFVMVVAGARNIDTVRGVTSVLLGRASDLVDGTVARSTGETSDFGAALDAGLDKLGMGAIFLAAARKRAIPQIALIGMVTHNLLNAAATIRHKRMHPNDPIRPSRLGKYSMFAENIAALAYISGNAADRSKAPRLRRGLNRLGTISSIVGISGGLITAAQYFARGTRANHSTAGLD